MLVRLKQLVDGADAPDDLPTYSSVRSALIEEFGADMFAAQEPYVRCWVRARWMSVCACATAFAKWDIHNDNYTWHKKGL